jgi:hypothetical protein
MVAADNVIDLMREAHFQFMDEAILPTLTRAELLPVAVPH